MIRPSNPSGRLIATALLGALWFALTGSAFIFGQGTATGTVNQPANLRAGPGTGYAIVGQLAAGAMVTIVDASTAGDWYRVDDNTWIAAFLVDRATPTATVTIRRQSLLPTTTPTPRPTSRRGVRSLLPTVTPTKLALTKPAPTKPPTTITVSPTRSPTATPTNTPTAPVAVPTIALSLPDALAVQAANLRGGPGLDYPVVGAALAGAPLTITAGTVDQSWYQLADGSWIAAFLVTQAPLAETLPAQVDPPPAALATATPAPTIAGNEFVLVQKHLLDPYENGGSLDGESVHCGQARALVVNVIDSNRNRINGVAVQVQYGAREIYVTGSQGKGDGVAEFVLGSGQDVKVLRDTDGREVSSDVATGLATYPAGIETRYLIESNYCQDEASCKRFVDGNACEGHYSWTVTFQRR